jgi:hypothetical protein
LNFGRVKNCQTYPPNQPLIATTGLGVFYLPGTYAVFVPGKITGRKAAFRPMSLSKNLFD